MKTLTVLILVLLASNIGCATMKKFGKAYGEEVRKQEAKSTNCISHVYGNTVNTNCN